MKSVLVLGGAGFIGVELIKALGESGECRITAADNLERGILDDTARAVFASTATRFVELDLTDGGAFAGLEGHVAPFILGKPRPSRR